MEHGGNTDTEGTTALPRGFIRVSSVFQGCFRVGSPTVFSSLVQETAVNLKNQVTSSLSVPGRPAARIATAALRRSNAPAAHCRWWLLRERGLVSPSG